MRMDVNGDGTLTKREMLAAEEFTPEEVSDDDNDDDFLPWHQTSMMIFLMKLKSETDAAKPFR